jgi:hypothetical protein
MADIVDGTTSTLHCGLHDFKTESIDEWHQHLVEEQGHYGVGHVICNLCGKPYHFTAEDKVPAVLATKGIAAHPECYSKQVGG